MAETTATETKKTVVEKIDIAQSVIEHESFEHIIDSKFIPSSELCGIVSDLLRSIYGDFEGCTFDLIPNRQMQGQFIPTFTLYFNHKDPATSTLPFACSKEIKEANVKNDTLRRTRIFDDKINHGDRYYLTQNGIDGLEPFIMNAFRKSDGTVNWGNVVADVADPMSSPFAGGVQLQYTKVEFIDPARMVEAIYGKVDKNDIKWVYDVRLLKSMPTMSFNGQQPVTNYMLAIERVCEPEVMALCNKLGIRFSNGLNIIR